MQTAMQQAICSGDILKVKELLQHGASVNAVEKAEGGLSPLHYAALHGQAIVAEELISAGAHVDAQSLSGDSPLYIAAQKGHGKVVDALIRAQACVDLQNRDGQSPLYIAVHNGFIGVVDSLICAQASVDLGEKYDYSPLCIAAYDGHGEVVDKLIRAQACVDLQQRCGHSPLCIAVDFGHSEVVAKLIRAQACIDLQQKDGYSPLYIAAQNGYCEIVDKLIRADACVDLQDKNGASPLYIAAEKGHIEVVDKLIHFNATVDLQRKDGYSPLCTAAEMGHDHIVKRLLHADADANPNSLLPPALASVKSGRVNTASLLIPLASKLLKENKMCHYFDACCFTYHSQMVVLLCEHLKWNHQSICELLSSKYSEALKKKLLIICEQYAVVVPSAKYQVSSLDLHKSMLDAGFCSANAILQSGTAAVIEDIIRLRKGTEPNFVVGSWADGWGSCFTRLNGDIGTDSDIDVTCILPRVPFHLPGVTICKMKQCRGVECKYEDGHILHELNVTKPSLHHVGSFLQPSVDDVSAYPCCSYPVIELLQANPKTCIPHSVIDDLRSMLTSTQCHVVSAAPPGQKCKKMRVSTTLLERRLMQSLTTLQGQFFVILKYLIKTVITKQMRVKGLKTYHAKNLLFWMLHETPEQDWQPDHLIKLVKSSLKILHDKLLHKDSSEQQCMKHFFLRDAAIYLHKEHASKQCIATAVTSVIDQLPQLLSQYQQTLVPSETGFIRFHPFVFYPDVFYRNIRHFTEKVKYHEVGELVEHILTQLSSERSTASHEQNLDQLLEYISRIPDFARCARESLKVLAHLRAGNRNDAIDVLIRANHSVSKGVRCDPSVSELTVDKAKDLVWKQLMESDSAWKFCFRFVTKPEFSFLSDHFRRAFPLLASRYNYTDMYYMNFDALMKGLKLEYLGDRVSAAQLFEDLSHGDADPQDLLMMMQFCKDKEIVFQALHNNGDIIRDSGLIDEVISFIEDEPTLFEKCIGATLDTAMKLRPCYKIM